MTPNEKFLNFQQRLIRTAIKSKDKTKPRYHFKE
jgi:hypothetical protein